MVFAVSASSSYTGTFLKLFILPLFFVAPLIAAIFASGPSKKIKRIRFLTLAFVLPGMSFLILFWSKLSDSYQNKIFLKNVHNNYVKSLAEADRNPSRAFLLCYFANHFETLDCSETLKFISQASFCRTLCDEKNRSDAELAKLCSTYGISLNIKCADLMIQRMDPQSPYDACMAAGLMNFQTAHGFFQGHYKRCLNSSLRVGTNKGQDGALLYEYKTLGEILKINTQDLPSHTQDPLPQP